MNINWTENCRFPSIWGICLTTLLALPTHGALLGTYTFPTESTVPSQTGMTFGAFQRQNVTAAPVSGVFRSSAWNTGGTIDANEYVQFILTPTVGNELTLTDFNFSFLSTKSNGSNNGGPRTLNLAVYAGTWSTGSNPGGSLVNQTFTLNNDGKNHSLAWDFADQSGSTGFTVRLYGWNAENALGTLAFDNFAINGSLVPVPEPTAIALGVFGVIFAGVGIGRASLRKFRLHNS